MLNTVVYQMPILYTDVLVNSAVLWSFMQCVYSVINPCGYWTSGTLSALASNGNTLYNVLGGKSHIMPVDLPESESISGTDIKPYCLHCKKWCPMLQFG